MSTTEQVQVVTQTEQPVEVEQSTVQELDEGLLRKALVKKWSGQESWYLKIIVLWNKGNHYRVRANWYTSRTTGKVAQSKFIHAIVGEDGGVVIDDKTITVEDVPFLKDRY